MSNNEVEDFLFLADLVHGGEYNIKIYWGDVFRVQEKILESDVRQCCKLAMEQGYTSGCDEDDPFMLLRAVNGMAVQRQEALLQRLLEVLQENAFALNVAALLYVQESLMRGILGSFYDHAIDFVDTSEERVFISMVTSPEFVRSEAVVEFMERHLSSVDDDLSGLRRYLDKPWFLELVLIIKNGYYGNGNFNYIDTLESSFRGRFIGGILDLVRNGQLVKLLLHFKSFLGDEEVMDKVRIFVRRTKIDAKLHKLYDWLSIGNDLAIGLEFLLGSICFLPGHDEKLGTWLFILGSSQLLFRPMIAIARKVHLGGLYRRKIKF